LNDQYKEFKERLRRLDRLLEEGGQTNADFAQALSRVRRAERHGDRSREPSPELRTLLERAEGLAPNGA
jgi:ABC-type transporter Mla subunit MlaD